MIDSSKSTSDRSIHISGHVSGNVLQTGENNIASVRYHRMTLPPEHMDSG